jgi:predicted acyl esterase
VTWWRAAATVRVGTAGPARALLAAAALLAGVGAAAPVALVVGASAASAATAGSVPAGFVGRGSIDQAYELGAPAHRALALVDAAGAVVGRGTTDRYGSLVVYDVAPGPGYVFRTTSGSSGHTEPFTVLGVHSTPPSSFYASQHMHAGLNYITMRDGISLAATVRLPPGKTLADGPFPTVIEYSGYAIAAPHSLIQALVHPTAATRRDPLVPDSATVVGSVLAPLLGFATVSLQMRGTGCSGGAFDLFGLPTTYDGYDAVQIVSAQPWVAHHKVGMVGISFSGISQMFVAGTRPPGLAAIAPMSITNDLYATGFPGGIFNSGFAASWVAQRIADAAPAPGGGQPWATAEIKDGDRTCLANQRLHDQTLNVEKILATNPYRTPSIYDVRSPTTWARSVDVPVFLAGALQDEQVGPQWPSIIPALSHDKDVFVTMVNGTHIDSLGPASITRWVEFLDLFVADKLPSIPSYLSGLSSLLYSESAGAPSEPLPPLRFTHAPSVAAARADFVRDDPRVRVLLDNGGGSDGPGAFQPEWEADFSSWPPSQAVPTTYDLAAGGALTGHPAAAAGQVSFRPDAAARPATDLSASANAWAPLPPYDWTPVTGSDGLGFLSAPLAHDETVVGPASLNLMLRSSAPDTDLQVTLSEVRPNGQEIYITSGFLRASDRALDPQTSTVLSPQPTFLASTARPLPRGRFTEVRIPIDPIAYAFRAGSRIRITITAPGGDRPSWAFDTTLDNGTAVDSVSLGGIHPSTLVLPVEPEITPPDAQPACPSLRGQPCRTYVPAGNGG